MSLHARQIRSPRPFDPVRGADVADATPQLAHLRDLVAGTAGSSPYLAGLLVKEADWLAQAEPTPEQAVAQIIAGLPDVALSDLPDHLRCAKRRIALMTALADLGGVWPLEQVTAVLTDFACAAVDATLRALVSAEIARGKLPGMTKKDAADTGGMVALAMGKMGAGELNYSSDIDLICLFDETRFAPDDYADARAAFVRVTRRMTAIMSEVTAEGYVFRTDLRLRPDASVTPVCLSMEAAERYYESLGRTWERAAFIKAHTCAGDRVAGARFLKTLRPFVWRKHLDFAAIQDAHDMRLRIRDHKGLHGPLVLEGHNMKLGRGGIREIEFFTQTRQLIAGGRDETLRVRGTRDGLQALAAAGWVPQDTADTLYDHYVAHRTVEHRLQMINDAQTHDLPNAPDGFARLAALMDSDVPDLRRDLRRRLDAVHTLTEGFFAPDAAKPAPTPEWGGEVTARWHSYPALRSERASAIFRRLRPEILARLAEAARPEEALLQFDAFLAGLPAGVQLFSLFEANPQLTQLIVDIAATAPALAQYLSRNAGVLDAVLGGSFFDQWPDHTTLGTSLAAACDAAPDYEARLNAARGWAKEWHFRIGVHHLRGLNDARTAGAQYADLARAVLAGLWPIVVDEFALKYGAPPGQGAVVLGMGSLGAGHLNAGSDLDLIMIYGADGNDLSTGAKPLAARVYYARLTQAFVTALSAPMAEGRLYEVDMRLRPSGRQGPVATSFAAFQDYQLNEAWTWEHLALTRAAVVAGAADLAVAVEGFRAKLLRAKSGGAQVLPDLAEMRHRIAAAKPGLGEWDAKIGAGRLQDCEFLAQAAALLAGSTAVDFQAQLDAGVAFGWLSAADMAAISQSYALFWQVQTVSRLLSGAVMDPLTLGEGGRRLLLQETGSPDMETLAREMDTKARAAAKVIAAKLRMDG